MPLETEWMRKDEAEKPSVFSLLAYMLLIGWLIWVYYRDRDYGWAIFMGFLLGTATQSLYAIFKHRTPT